MMQYLISFLVLFQTQFLNTANELVKDLESEKYKDQCSNILNLTETCKTMAGLSNSSIKFDWSISILSTLAKSSEYCGDFMKISDCLKTGQPICQPGHSDANYNELHLAYNAHQTLGYICPIYNDLKDTITVCLGDDVKQMSCLENVSEHVMDECGFQEYSILCSIASSPLENKLCRNISKLHSILESSIVMDSCPKWRKINYCSKKTEKFLELLCKGSPPGATSLDTFPTNALLGYGLEGYVLVREKVLTSEPGYSGETHSIITIIVSGTVGFVTGVAGTAMYLKRRDKKKLVQDVRGPKSDDKKQETENNFQNVDKKPSQHITFQR